MKQRGWGSFVFLAVLSAPFFSSACEAPLIRFPDIEIKNAWKDVEVQDRFRRLLTRGVFWNAPTHIEPFMKILASGENEALSNEEVFAKLRDYRAQHLNSFEELFKSDDAARVEARARQLHDLLGSSFRVKSMLDVGAGEGWVTAALARQLKLKPANVVAYDVVPVSVPAVDAQLVRVTGHPSAGILNDISDSFDLVLFLSVLHHTADPLAALQDARRLIRQKGRIIVREMHAPTTATKIFNALVDELYDRVLYQVPVVPPTLQYRGVLEWRELFQRAGLKIVQQTWSGDHDPRNPNHNPVDPVYFVLEKAAP
jgi:2-polyprenyl-3-methyl-5-hydroxy-6-metoxy-1,4-benzoquinol methylase